MRQEDRQLILESLRDVTQFIIPSDISPTSIPVNGIEKSNLFKDPMQKQVERSLKLYEQNHSDIIPFKSLTAEVWLVNIDKQGKIRLVKELRGKFSQAMHAYDDTAILYYYKNIVIGLAVHDHTEDDSIGSYYWYFIPGSEFADTHRLYYLCSAYYFEYGVTEFLLKNIRDMNKS